MLAREVEYGKGTVSIGKAMQSLAELGVRMSVEIPDSAAPLVSVR